MADISDPKWTEQDPANNSASPDGVQGGYSPKTIAPILQATRGAIKRSYNRINAMYATTGTATALVLTYAQAPAQYLKGERIAFFPNVTNTGAMTLNINTIGAKSILRADGSALAAGDVASGQFTEVIYDGTAFRLINSAGNVYKGDGSALTNLNGSAIASGTVADARLPTSMAGKTFTSPIALTSINGANDTNGVVITGGSTGGANIELYGPSAGGASNSIYYDAATHAFRQANGAGTPNVTIGGWNAWHAGNFDPNTKASLSGATFAGNIGLAGTGNNWLSAGTGDNATYSTYNLALNGWFGLGMKSASDNAVNGVYNFRTGTWDTKGGFFKNGVSAVYNDGGAQQWNISIQGSAGYLGGRPSSTIWDNSNGNYKKSAEGTDRICFDNNGRTAIGGGSSGYLLTVFQSGIGDKLHVSNDGNIWMAWANDWMSNLLASKVTNNYNQRANIHITGNARTVGQNGGDAGMVFNWSGQGGQPTWLWGGNDGINHYVYNPANFSVNYANGSGNSNAVQGYNFDGNPIRIPLMQISDNVNETNYPIGTTLVAVCANNTNVARRGPCNIYLHATDNRYFRFDTGSTVLPGGWRNMGCINSTMYYFQRTY